MKSDRSGFGKKTLVCGAAIAALLAATPSLGQTAASTLSIPAQPVETALRELARKTGVDILFTPEALRGLRSKPISGAFTPRQAAEAIVAGDNLEVVQGGSGSLVVRRRSDPSSPQPAAQETQGETAQQVAEVVVTANKRAERLQDVPEGITALTGNELRRNQAHRFEDYLTQVPGLNYLSSGEGSTQLILRGITAGASQLSSTVGVYVDEAPYGTSTVFSGGATSTPDFDTSDISRIEVLKGPQGTLYGADSLGGVLKFVTTPPNASTYSGHIDVGGSSVDGGGEGYNVSGALNAPIIQDQLALRISAYDRHDPGYIDDPSRGLKNINGANVQGMRLALLWKPVQDLSVTVSALGQDVHVSNPSGEDVSIPSLTPITGDRQQSRLIDQPSDFSYRLYDATVNWDLHWATLVSATSYSTLLSNGITDETEVYGPELSAVLGAPVGVEISEPIQRQKFTQEIRLQSPDNQTLEWRAGFYFTHERSDTDQHLDAFSPATDQTLPINLFTFHGPSQYNEYAGFGDLTYHFTPRIDVTVGVRYSENDQRFSETETGLLAGPAGVAFSRTSSDSSTTWLFNPRFKVTDDVMIYGRIATGYRPGGPTLAIPGTPEPDTFRPDTLTDYETGVKASLLDKRLTLDADIFYIDWKDIQLDEIINNFVLIGNGGTARSQGVEASAAYTPFRGLNLSANLAYTDAHLTEDAVGVGGLDGARLPGVPMWNASVDASYDWTLQPGWDASAGAGYRFVGDRLSDFNTLPGTLTPGPRYNLPSYGVTDLRIGVTHEAVMFTFYIKNAGDVRGITALGPNTTSYSAGPFSAFIIQPRTFGVDLSAKF